MTDSGSFEADSIEKLIAGACGDWRRIGPLAFDVEDWAERTRKAATPLRAPTLNNELLATRYRWLMVWKDGEIDEQHSKCTFETLKDDRGQPVFANIGGEAA